MRLTCINQPLAGIGCKLNSVYLATILEASCRRVMRGLGSHTSSALDGRGSRAGHLKIKP